MSVSIYLEKTERHNDPELNVSNKNFRDLWAFLEIPEQDWVGEVSGPVLRSRINYKMRDKYALAAPDRREGKVLECGRTPEQVERYFKTLNRLADLAIVRKCKVVWS